MTTKQVLFGILLAFAGFGVHEVCNFPLNSGGSGLDILHLCRNVLRAVPCRFFATEGKSSSTKKQPHGTRLKALLKIIKVKCALVIFNKIRTSAMRTNLVAGAKTHKRKNNADDGSEWEE